MITACSDVWPTCITFLSTLSSFKPYAKLQQISSLIASRTRRRMGRSVGSEAPACIYLELGGRKVRIVSYPGLLRSSIMSRMEENRAKDPSYHANCQSKSLWKPVVPHLPTLGDVSNACQTETCIVAKAQSPNGAGKNIISQHAVGRSSPIRFVQVGGCIAGITTTSGADTCTTNTTASSTRNAAASQVQTTGSRITKENTARCQAKPLAKGESCGVTFREQKYRVKKQGLVLEAARPGSKETTNLPKLVFKGNSSSRSCRYKLLKTPSNKRRLQKQLKHQAIDAFPDDLENFFAKGDDTANSNLSPASILKQSVVDNTPAPSQPSTSLPASTPDDVSAKCLNVAAGDEKVHNETSAGKDDSNLEVITEEICSGILSALSPEECCAFTDNSEFNKANFSWEWSNESQDIFPPTPPRHKDDNSVSGEACSEPAEHILEMPCDQSHLACSIRSGLHDPPASGCGSSAPLGQGCSAPWKSAMNLDFSSPHVPLWSCGTPEDEVLDTLLQTPPVRIEVASIPPGSISNSRSDGSEFSSQQASRPFELEACTIPQDLQMCPPSAMDDDADFTTLGEQSLMFDFEIEP